MSKAIKLQAREIHRYARRFGHTLKRGSYKDCAMNIVARMAGITKFDQRYEDVANRLGLKTGDIWNLECGFEGWHMMGDTNNRYYRVGANLFDKVGSA